ncbi:MAG: Aspartate aminotransferase [Planctomycetota bacterium]|jgi:aspartate/tyrosine/aromatic aminotransferase
MFENFSLAPPDPILGLNAVFEKDPRPFKLNLTVGVFKDDQGRTPILESVRQAEAKIFQTQKTKGYLPIEGGKDFTDQVNRLILGEGFEFGRVATAHTPGGTGALRAAADTLTKVMPGRRFWVSNPTWANHNAVFQAAGFPVLSYAYLDAAKTGLDFDGLIRQLEQEGQPGDAVCLHACCHNPTGIDPTPAQWGAISELLAKKRMLPFIDFAYQGFGDGLEADAKPISILLKDHSELVICGSFSKNFGLYSERVGALLMISADSKITESVLSQMRVAIRCNYSNPPRHGEAIVATILGDPELSKLWRSEVDAMRKRISEMRVGFIDGMKKRGKDFSFLASQKGMFSYTGLNAMQADWLKQEKGIYIVGTGRINVAGLTSATLESVCDAVAQA